MNEDKAFLAGAFISCFACCAVTAVFIHHSEKAWEERAIKHGAAQYNATTGEFEWKKQAVQNNSSETTP